ncbi:hypothetical protein C8Q74DRAFT_1440801 [Fomes fomentarius]|nr:hypothetical protein C8Q74DRAFT_1440801 [Fomes fomentarius]
MTNLLDLNILASQFQERGVSSDHLSRDSCLSVLHAAISVVASSELADESPFPEPQPLNWSDQLAKAMAILGSVHEDGHSACAAVGVAAGAVNIYIATNPPPTTSLITRLQSCVGSFQKLWSASDADGPSKLETLLVSLSQTGYLRGQRSIDDAREGLMKDLEDLNVYKQARDVIDLMKIIERQTQQLNLQSSHPNLEIVKPLLHSLKWFSISLKALKTLGLSSLAQEISTAYRFFEAFYILLLDSPQNYHLKLTFINEADPPRTITVISGQKPFIDLLSICCGADLPQWQLTNLLKHASRVSPQLYSDAASGQYSVDGCYIHPEVAMFRHLVEHDLTKAVSFIAQSEPPCFGCKLYIQSILDFYTGWEPRWRQDRPIQIPVVVAWCYPGPGGDEVEKMFVSGLVDILLEHTYDYPITSKVFYGTVKVDPCSLITMYKDFPLI